MRVVAYLRRASSLLRTRARCVSLLLLTCCLDLLFRSADLSFKDAHVDDFTCRAQSGERLSFCLVLWGNSIREWSVYSVRVHDLYLVCSSQYGRA